MKKQGKKLASKPSVRKVAKTFSNPKSSAIKKSDAGKTLVRQVETVRKIQPAPKVGSISRIVARKVARKVAKVVHGRKK